MKDFQIIALYFARSSAAIDETHKKYGQSHAKKRNRDLEVSLTELGGHISLFLRSQPPQERDWFVRRYWMFDPIKNIARDSHCSQSKIKSALMRTRKKLSAYLKNNYFDGGEV